MLQTQGRHSRWAQRAPRIAFALGVAVIAQIADSANCSGKPIPHVKQWTAGEGNLRLPSVAIDTRGGDLNNEARVLAEQLDRLGIPMAPEGVLIRLEIGEVSFPPIESAYRERIENQGYRLVVGGDGIHVQASSPAGVFYGVQTLTQLVDADKTVPQVTILDWPDLAVRMVMVDPARANENAGYYMRLVQFCARYKLNGIHVHLTDDQNACLYHEDYPSLMHPHAWRTEELASLIEFAKRYHLELVPEIESLGHARLFVRHLEFREFLHQTTADKPAKSWAGTNVPGYTNVLCPASDRAVEYLGRMYTTAARAFPYPELHVGLDEVDMTTCARCEAKFPGASHSEWFLGHLLRCRDFVTQKDRRLALWGDMLLHHRDIIDRVPTKDTVIYDWHYNPDMTDESAAFFKAHGFTVMACPALVCHPHMILPSDYNYENIRRFAEIARQHDLLGLDTTIWTPTRYLSDVLWPGIAYAAVHAWSGSHWDESSFYTGFAQDAFGTERGQEFAQAWKGLAGITWRLDEFRASCWLDDQSLADAQEKASGEWGTRAIGYLDTLERIRKQLAPIGRTVERNREAWGAIDQSAAILAYTMEHLLASREVRRDGRWNIELLRRLDETCARAIRWIERDWDRNRFADDPYKDDLNHTNQHLLARFRQMHAYHQSVLRAEAEKTEPPVDGAAPTDSRENPSRAWRASSASLRGRSTG